MKSNHKTLLLLLVSVLLVEQATQGLAEDRAVGDVQRSSADAHGMANNSRYTVTGRTFYSSFGVGREFTHDFTLTVSNECWAMEFLDVPPDVRHIQNYDGSNLVAFTYFNQARERSAWNNGYVLVDNRRVPICEPEAAHAVFVGFAGQFYLPPGTNGSLCPLWHPEREVNQTAFVASDWRLLAPGRPEMLRCYYEARKWDKALHKVRSTGTSRDHEEQALIAVYRSVGETNVFGGMFPTAYSFKAFAPDREDGGDKTSPVYEIQVTNVVVRSTVIMGLFDRQFKGAAVVEDYRGSLREPVTYNITNSAPPRLR